MTKQMMVRSPKIIALREKRTFPNNCSSAQSFRMKGGMERLDVRVGNAKYCVANNMLGKYSESDIKQTSLPVKTYLCF